MFPFCRVRGTVPKPEGDHSSVKGRVTMKIEKALFGAVVLLALIACKKGGDEKSGETTTAASGDKVGVAECDEYLEKYEKCLKDKVPEAARGSMESAMKQMRDSWKTAAATPEAKAGLATGCKSALDAAKTSMASFGCTW